MMRRITYIRLASGVAYLVAIIEWQSRSIQQRPWPQSTSVAFTGALKRKGITISMGGRGCASDNVSMEGLWRSVKHEDVHLNGYATMGELLIGLMKYFVLYNGERPHQVLGNQTHMRCMQTGQAVVP